MKDARYYLTLIPRKKVKECEAICDLKQLNKISKLRGVHTRQGQGQCKMVDRDGDRDRANKGGCSIGRGLFDRNMDRDGDQDIDRIGTQRA